MNQDESEAYRRRADAIANQGYKKLRKQAQLRAWEATAISHMAPANVGLEDFSLACRPADRESFSVAAQFSLAGDGPIERLLGVGSSEQEEFFRILFSHSVVRKAFPEVGEVSLSNPSLAFNYLDGFSALAGLALHVRNGPSYPLVNPRTVTSDQDALDLALGFADAACQRRLTSSRAWISNQSWAANHSGRDYTLVWITNEFNLFTIYMFSDAHYYD